MAKVSIDFDEIETRALPFVCMKCGRKADLWKKKHFDWEKLGKAGLRLLGPVPGGPKLYEVTVPLCRADKNHWLWRGLFTWGVGIPLIAYLLGMIGLIAEGPPAVKQWLAGTGKILGPLLALDILILLPSWIITVLILRRFTIRPIQITRRAIVFGGVSAAFVEQLAAMREVPRDAHGPEMLAKYRVVGLPVEGGSEQIVASFDDRAKAQEFMSFLEGAGQFTKLTIKEGAENARP